MEAAVDEDHPAHEWFTWDVSKVSHAYLLAQARDFVSGLRCKRVQTYYGSRSSALRDDARHRGYAHR